VLAEGHERARLEPSVSAMTEGDRHTMLVFASPDDGRMAIPLGRVARLEEFPRGVVERVGREKLVQYRGEIMPVIELSSLLVERRVAPRVNTTSLERGVIQVVVFAHNGGHVGLIVDQILDIVDEALTNPRPPGRPSVLGTVVIAGRVTELLDVEAVLRRAQPVAGWTETADLTAAASAAQNGLGHGA
jgi:two-component system chemotaxis sensor kinase CheA